MKKKPQGTMSLQLLVIMVPVFFGFMGFAIDLGRLYLIRGELNEAANAMALAAAAQLNGSTGADTNALTVLSPPLGSGPTYNYNFGSVPVGQGAGNLTSTINAPACYAAAGDAVAGNSNTTDCSTAQFVQVSLTADAPLLFWSLLPGGQSGKTSIAAQAVAGISAPLCTACNIVPIGIVAINSSDTVNFGFDATDSTIYTFAYSCLGTPPPILSGNVPYYILNRLDSGSPLTENDQLYVDGAGGLTASPTPTPNANTSNASTPLACVNVADQEEVWTNAVPLACSTVAPPRTTIESLLCGVYSRLDNTQTPGACTLAVDDFGTLSPSYLPDTDVLAGEVPPYSAYTGNGRRLITVAIMDRAPLTATDNPTVLAFRQFLLVPNTDGTFFQPTDPYGRFPALYIGNPAPVQTGWFDSRYANACVQGSFTGPGKVVLHQ